MKSMKVLTVLSLFFLLMVVGGREILAAETIHVYTYHIHPPFVNESSVGQTFELTSQLNAAAGEKFDFKVSQIPRSRLNMLLKNWVDGKCGSGSPGGCDDNWILLWVNQKWGFGSDPQGNFNWVKIAEDSNAIISLQSAKVVYDNPESLNGLKFGGIAGHRYVGIDDLVESGLITRIDGSHERDNILKLSKKRVDVILLPTSTINYFMRHDPLISSFADTLYVAEKKHQSYSRNIMIPKSRGDLFNLCDSLDMSHYQK